MDKHNVDRTFLFAVFLVVILCDTNINAEDTKTSFEDTRCKCVCPKFHEKENSSINDRTVFISPNADPNKCNCDYVLGLQVKVPVDTKLCSMCQCKYENRNTTTIKVVVILITCVTSALLVYMLFLLCLDPLIARRPSSYIEHMDENRVSLTTNTSDDQTVSQVPQFDSGTRPRMGRQKSVINYVSNEQKRWKNTVQEQRRNIYDKHTMLN